MLGTKSKLYVCQNAIEFQVFHDMADNNMFPDFTDCRVQRDRPIVLQITSLLSPFLTIRTIAIVEQVLVHCYSYYAHKLACLAILTYVATVSCIHSVSL